MNKVIYRISCAVLFASLAIFFTAGSADAAKKKKTAVASHAEDVVEKEDVVPQTVVDLLSEADLEGALLTLRDADNNPKTKFLMRELTRLSKFEVEGVKSKSKADVHSEYQNVAISYHNLYLFLKSRSIEQEDFYNAALKYYNKAKGSGSPLHKEECNLLTAALYADEGETEKAEKLFSKIDVDLLRGDFESMEYLAAYYAAVGDAEGAMEIIQDAFILSPERTIAWLRIGDDFYSLKSLPEFALLVDKLKKQPSGDLKLRLPSAKQPKLDVQDSTGLFIAKEDLPRYSLKKRRPVSKGELSAKLQVQAKKPVTKVSKKSARKKAKQVKKQTATKVTPATKTGVQTPATKSSPARSDPKVKSSAVKAKPVAAPSKKTKVKVQPVKPKAKPVAAPAPIKKASAVNQGPSTQKK